jgi:hypothetical protein
MVIKKLESSKADSINLANPAPLGLLGFGMTTVLLNLHNADFIVLNSMILAMGIFYGGLAQIIAGILEWKKNNTFGMTAFISYGFFWLSLVGIIIMPQMGLAVKTDSISMAVYLFMWGLFTAIMFVATLKLSKSLQFIFGSLMLLFLLLSMADLSGSAIIKVVAGYEGIVCGFSAIYTAGAQILNEAYKRQILPV